MAVYTTIDKPSDYFETVLYTGTGSTQSITSLDFQPDWVWGKTRNDTQDHQIIDSVRGATKLLATNGTAVEFTDTNNLTSFNSNGFTVGSSGGINGSSDTLVTWCWKAGGSASSNSNGSITSTVSASTDSGFSIVKWTGNGSNPSTVGHGLGAVPKMIITKRISGDTASWHSYHAGIGNAYDIYLNGANAKASDTSWNSTTPTSSVFTVNGANVNVSGAPYIAYCFADVKGFSKFGSYVGNGNADGTFVYTGFSPAFVIVKRTDAVESWFLYDNKRNAHVGNERYYVLKPNTAGAENTTYSDNWQMDFLSNGFKLRTTAGHLNSGNLIYMAFAENPFVTSTGVPATAR